MRQVTNYFSCCEPLGHLQTVERNLATCCLHFNPGINQIRTEVLFIISIILCLFFYLSHFQGKMSSEGFYVNHLDISEHSS